MDSNNHLISYSTFSKGFLEEYLSQHHGLKGISLRFLKRGFNDTYFVESLSGKFILRIYRHGRRTLEEIRAEVKLLLFLGQQGLPVSLPIPDQEAVFIHAFPAPEGIRHAVLFTFSEGKSLRKPSVSQCREIGTALGHIHHAALQYDPGSLTWTYHPSSVFQLVRTAVSEKLKSFPEEMIYLDKLEQAVSKHLKGIELKTGICHGDLQPENFLFESGRGITFIDFDFAGKGPLLYDLGAYTWYDHQGKTNAMLHAFYEGYAQVAGLTQPERELIPLFGALRALFLMGMWNQFMDGDSNPEWKPEQIVNFIVKLRKWVEERCRISVV